MARAVVGRATTMKMREPGLGSTADHGAGFARRLLTAAVLVPFFVWLVTRAPGWAYAALVSAVAAVALWELLRLFDYAGQPVYRRLGLVLGIALTASFEVAGGTPAVIPLLPVAVLTAAVVALLSAPVWTGAPPAVEPVALTLLAVLYVGWFIGHALLLHRLRDGDALVLMLVGVTWIGETAAYIVGSTLGRHPLAPALSPQKTVEGAAAQFVSSIAAAAALGTWLLPGWTLGQAVLAGALLGVTGQVGDLAESAIKRSVRVKDAGGLIPGHGGVLDRIDGLLFNVPALYYYVRLGLAA